MSKLRIFSRLVHVGWQRCIWNMWMHAYLSCRVYSTMHGILQGNLEAMHDQSGPFWHLTYGVRVHEEGVYTYVMIMEIEKASGGLCSGSTACNAGPHLDDPAINRCSFPHFFLQQKRITWYGHSWRSRRSFLLWIMTKFWFLVFFFDRSWRELGHSHVWNWM